MWLMNIFTTVITAEGKVWNGVNQNGSKNSTFSYSV